MQASEFELPEVTVYATPELIDFVMASSSVGDTPPPTATLTIIKKTPNKIPLDLVIVHTKLRIYEKYSG